MWRMIEVSIKHATTQYEESVKIAWQTWTSKSFNVKSQLCLQQCEEWLNWIKGKQIILTMRLNAKPTQKLALTVKI